MRSYTTNKNEVFIILSFLGGCLWSDGTVELLPWGAGCALGRCPLCLLGWVLGRPGLTPAPLHARALPVRPNSVTRGLLPSVLLGGWAEHRGSGPGAHMLRGLRQGLAVAGGRLSR